MRAWLVALAACGSFDKPVGHCVYWEDCGDGGQCEYSAPQQQTPPEFACSFADSSCEETGRRFGEYSAPQFAGQCVAYVADVFDGYCDDARPCSGGRACVTNRCISYAGLSAGGGMSAAVCSHDSHQGGDLWLWGISFAPTELVINTQFGEGSVPPPPMPAAPLFQTLTVTIGAVHLCVTGQSPSPFSQCTGRNDLVGNGGVGTVNGWIATPLGTGAAPGSAHTALSASIGHTCGVRAGAVDCWGNNEAGQLDGIPGAASPTALTTTITGRVEHLVAGTTFTCASTPAQIFCWGGAWAPNTFAVDPITPTPPPHVVGLPDGDTAALDAGQAHACAIKNGEVWCWGANAAGQSTGAPTAFPVLATKVALDQPAIAIATGDNHSCAVTATHDIYCWGSNSLGQLGSDGAGPGPVRVPFVAPASDLIASGHDHTCAVLADSIAHCWGAPDVVDVPPSLSSHDPECL